MTTYANPSCSNTIKAYETDMEDERDFDCPCCGFPTLTEPGGFDICSVCWWQDDGQNDHNADRVLGGPNGAYSLSKARENFTLHGHMYDAGKGISVVQKPTDERLALIEFVKRNQPIDARFIYQEFKRLLDASDRSHRDS